MNPENQQNTPPGVSITAAQPVPVPQASPTIIASPTYKKATFVNRLIAFLIDYAILFTIEVVLLVVLGLILKFKSVAYIDYLISGLYGVFFLAIRGATPGMQIMDMRIVSASYQKIGWGRAIVRQLAAILSSLVFSLGYVWMLIDKESQTWHDKIAKTYVLKLDPYESPIPAVAESVVTTGRKIAFWVLFLVFGAPLVFGTVFVLVYALLFRPFQVNGQAMFPTMRDGEYIMTNISAARSGQLQRGDIIILKAPPDPTKDFVKRIIGVSGDTVMISGGKVYLNGVMLDETKYLSSNMETAPGAFLGEGQAITVPQNDYFVLGDNREFSSDSREWGFVPKENVIGKYMMCYWNCPQQ